MKYINDLKETKKRLLYILFEIGDIWQDDYKGISFRSKKILNNPNSMERITYRLQNKFQNKVTRKMYVKVLSDFLTFLNNNKEPLCLNSFDENGNKHNSDKPLPEILEFVITKSLDEDRYIPWNYFKAILNELRIYSKLQCFLLLAGMTGFRPIELARLTTESLNFSDPNKPIIINKITKTKKKTYFDTKGRVIATKLIKIKNRIIPIWVRDYLIEYMKYQAFKQDGNGNAFLFSTNNYDPQKKYISTNSWTAYLYKLRIKLINKNPEYWKWIEEPAYERIIMGKKSHVCKLSLYSFRKSHATWYAMKLLENGVSDVILGVKHHMGHQDRKTTYTYVQQLLHEREAGDLKDFKAPDLQENILSVKNIEKLELQTIIAKISNHPEFNKIINQIIKNKE